jgi:hypothetical protein
MYFFLSFSISTSLLLLTLQSQKGKRSFVNRLYAESNTQMKNKDEQVIFLSPPLEKLKKSKVSFLDYFFFFLSVKQPKNRTICLLYIKNIFLPVSFFV